MLCAYLNLGVGDGAGGCPGVSTKIQGYRITCPGIGRLASMAMGCIEDVLFLSPCKGEGTIYSVQPEVCMHQSTIHHYSNYLPDLLAALFLPFLAVAWIQVVYNIIYIYMYSSV